MKYDVIGDVHGHALALAALLGKLGYVRRSGVWRHSDRTAVFVGDFIDRGPGQLDTLNIVRPMVDAGFARAVMGNHEFNAIAWATPDPENPGKHLRPRHGEKGAQNLRQHEAFLEEVGIDTDAHRAWIDWFLELPLWIDEPGFRVVHACWSERQVQMLTPYLREDAKLKRDLIPQYSRKGNDLYDAVEVLLKGVEIDLPHGVSFKDKEGTPRHSMRTRWWDPTISTYRNAYMGPPGAQIPNVPLPKDVPILEAPDRATFIGHYWLDPASPLEPRSERVVCVDFSVAKQGPLVAYRFDGESTLGREKFVSAHG